MIVILIPHFELVPKIMLDLYLTQFINTYFSFQDPIPSQKRENNPYVKRFKELPFQHAEQSSLGHCLFFFIIIFCPLKGHFFPFLKIYKPIV